MSYFRQKSASLGKYTLTGGMIGATLGAAKGMTQKFHSSREERGPIKRRNIINNALLGGTLGAFGGAGLNLAIGEGKAFNKVDNIIDQYNDGTNKIKGYVKQINDNNTQIKALEKQVTEKQNIIQNPETTQGIINNLMQNGNQNKVEDTRAAADLLIRKGKASLDASKASKAGLLDKEKFPPRATKKVMNNRGYTQLFQGDKINDYASQGKDITQLKGAVIKENPKTGRISIIHKDEAITGDRDKVKHQQAINEYRTWLGFGANAPAETKFKNFDRNMLDDKYEFDISA